MILWFISGSHTCFFTVDLPEYSTTEIMYERLNYAITNCSNIDGDGNMNERPETRNLDSDLDEDELWDWQSFAALLLFCSLRVFHNKIGHGPVTEQLVHVTVNWWKQFFSSRNENHWQFYEGIVKNNGWSKSSWKKVEAYIPDADGDTISTLFWVHIVEHLLYW